MGAAHSISTSLGKTLVFSGRASRHEFWCLFAFGSVVVGCLLTIATLIDNFLIDQGSRISGDYHPAIWLTLVVSGLPILSCGFRRLQDIGWPGLLVLSPIVVVVLALLGRLLISGSSNNPGYDGYASWPFAILMICVFLISIGVLLAAFLMASQTGPNKYGPNPHEVTP